MNRWLQRALAGVTAAGTTACVVVLSASPALAAPPQSPATLQVVKTLSSAFVGPLQFAVARNNHVYVADSFTSSLFEIGNAKPIATGPSPATGGDLSGVAVDRAGTIAYTTSSGDHSVTKLTILEKGKKPVVADLSGFEKRVNPDGKIHYGVDNPSACVTKALTKAMVPVSYTGEVDSHPYAVASLGHGAWAVADAGGNDLLKVDRYGHVSLIAVLPPQPVVVTKAFAAASGITDPCVVGITYKFEAVPTDVEVGPNHALYVTTLPGGPEGPDSGNPGSVYRVHRDGRSTRVATGFVSATNLAISPDGTIYVAELGAGRISKVDCGQRKTVINLPGVVAVEWANGHLYASTAPLAADGKGPGTIVELGRKSS